jgi:hypothetical protein
VEKALVISLQLLAAPVIQAIKELIVHNWTPPTLAGHPVILQPLNAVIMEPVIYLLTSVAPAMMVI